MGSLSFLVLFVFASLARASIGPTASLVITNKKFAPDGYSRDTVVANNQFPGPLIVGNKGTQFNIFVTDALTDSQLDRVTSIHWHGMFQHSTAHADGVAFVTQCPLTPAESFQYQFSVPDQAGTYWYHSHYRNQYCDGLRGALVIYDPHDPQAHLYDVDNEGTVITLADWYHYLSPDAPQFPAPISTLINGKGRYAGGPNVALSVVNVQAGKRYRFRLVSISCDSNFVFSIDKHQFSVIEVDGVSHEPVLIDSVQIFVAQRYSLVMAANQPVDNYWIRAKPNNIGDGSFTNGTNSAILRYAGAPAKDPSSTSTLSLPLNEQDLHPLTDAAAPGVPEPGKADINIELDVNFDGPSGMFTVNGYPFQSPSVPVLLQILSGTPPANLLPNNSVINLERNKVVEITIPGGAAGGPHPVHLHGHVFSVVRSAGNSTYNFVNPPKRDVVSIGTTPADRTTFRFVTDNPGPWFLHCHIDWHLNTGFAVVMSEAPTDIPNLDHPPLDWKTLCPVYDAYAKINHLNP